MRKKKQVMIWVLILILAVACPSCSAGTDIEEDNILYAASNFAYPSLDAHKEYYGWYTSVYGITETLFRLDDQAVLQPWLAESGTLDGTVWTIILKENITFSNGTEVTADMVVRNLQRAADENSRFAYMGDFTYSIIDSRTFTIESDEIYPTMLNSLACPELAVLDLDNIADFDNAVVGTGPFIIDTFEPEGTVTVTKNNSYWNGEVQLDGAIFYYMQDDDTKLMAMQNGEIDCYNSVTAAAIEMYEADPETYQLDSVPATRLQFYILNQRTMSSQVRQAVNLIIDAEHMAEYLGGTVTPTVGPFSENAAYGQVQKPEPDQQAAEALLHADGYVKNEEGYYEKDGVVLNIRIAYYEARSLDTLAAVMQEQLRRAGIQAVLICEEDPDATYIANSDFDLALYCMISDTSGDPEYFITSTLAENSYFNVAGFEHARCEALIRELRHETDPDRRAELANEIIQISIDEHALGYIALFNKVTVRKKGVTGFAEESPYDFYGIDADTVKMR